MNFKQFAVALGILIVLAALFGAWASRTGQGVVSQNEHVLKGEQIGEGYYRYAEDQPYFTIEALYPGGTGLSAAADLKARLTIEQALADRIATFKSDNRLEALTPADAEIIGLTEGRQYALQMEYTEYTSPDYVSYVYSIYEDTLGAHPNGYYLTFVFDKQGNKVSLNEVLSNNPNALEELSLVASNQVVAQYKERAGVDDTTGLLFDEGLAPTVGNYVNFYIDGADLVVLFPPYQVAAYALGSFEARVPLAEMNR